MVWAGDDWEYSSASKHRLGIGGSSRVMDDHNHDHDDDVSTEKQRLLPSEKREFSNSLSSSSSTREVKIKISKRELEELVHRVDMQGLSLEQILTKLIDANIDHHQQQQQQHPLEHQRSWRPVLQSIPEVN